MAQIKLAEYTFDNSVGDCLPTLRLSSIQMTTEDIISGVITKRTVYIDDTTLPYRLYFQNQTALLTVDYLHIGSNITDLSSMFSGCTKLKTVNTTNWDLSSCTNISFMFQNCSSLTKLDLRNWVTGSITTMQGMFHSCTSLTEIKGIENFNVSSVTSFGTMFYLCKSLIKLDLRNWVTGSCTSFQDMFSSCHNLEVIRVDNFDTSKVTGTGLNAMFSYCKKVKTLNLNSFVNAGLGNFLGFCSNCTSLEYISAQNFIWGNCNAMQGAFTNCKSLKMLDLTNFDGTTIKSTDALRLSGFDGVTCPIYYNSNMCTQYDTPLTSLSNAVDVKGRLMAIYDFNNSSTNADMPTLTGSMVTKTIDTQGSESYITHRVIGVDVMPTAISFNSIRGLLNVDYLAVTNSCTQLGGLFDGCGHLESINTFGWDTSNVQGQNNRMFTGCSQLTELDMTWFNTSKITMMRDMFSGCSKLTELDLSSFNTENVTSFQSMFNGCTNLVTLNVSSFNTEKCTHFPYMFWGCTSLQELDLTNFNTTKNTMGDSIFNLMTSNQIVYVHDTNWTLDTAPVTVVRRLSKLLAQYTFDNSIGDCVVTMSGISTDDYVVGDVINGTTTKRLITTESGVPTWYQFYQQTSLLTVDYLNVDNNVKSLNGTFEGCSNLTFVEGSNWDTSNVTDMKNMFNFCIKLTTINGIELWNVKKVQTIHDAFNTTKLTTLDLSQWQTQSLQSIEGAFKNNGQLTTLDISTWDVSKVSACYAAFRGCSGLTELDLSQWKLTNVTNCDQMFWGCRNIRELNLLGWDTRKVTSSVGNMLAEWTSDQTVYYEPPYWSLGTTSLNSDINWVINVTRSNGYWLDMTGITEPVTITMTNPNNLTTSEIMIDWGDGTNNTELNHTYSTAGQYVIATNLYHDPGIIKPYLTKAHFNYSSGTITGLLFQCPKVKEFTITDNFINEINSSKKFYNMDRMFNGCYALEYLPSNFTQIDITNISGIGSAFNYSGFKELDFTGWTNHKISNWAGAFHSCQQLEKVNFGTLDMTPVTDMSTMFAYCSKLVEINVGTNWNTSNVTSMAGMFNGCKALTSLDVSSWNFTKCNAINQFIRETTNLVDFNMSGVTFGATGVNFQNFAYQSGVQNVNMSNITTAGRVSFESPFYGCGKLKTIDFSNSHFKPNGMQNMFRGCSSLTSLDLSSWDVSQCTSMQDMFNGCGIGVINLANWNTSKVTLFGGMFSNCSNLTHADLSGFTAENCTGCANMFLNCTNLKTVDLSSFNPLASKKVNSEGMFASCSSLEKIDLSNFDTESMSKFNNLLNWGSPNIILGLLYASASTINDIISTWGSVENGIVYYYDADPSQLTPVKGVTFKKYAFPTTIQLPPHIQLHSLPDGTRDEVDIKTGILTRNVVTHPITGELTNLYKKIIFDGSEDEAWNIIGRNNGYIRIWIGNQAGLTPIENSKTNITYCNNFTPVSCAYANEYIDNGRFIFQNIYEGANNQGVQIQMLGSEVAGNNVPSISQWRNYLKSNPIIIHHLTSNAQKTEQLILNYNNSCDYGRILPTGMCDKYSVVDSMYTQTMTSILLDGANTWDAMEEFENTVKFTATGTTVGVENLNMLGAGGLYCDNDLFPNINDDSDVPHCRVDEAGNKFYIYVDKEMLMSPDLIGWQIWLQANPFNLIYELAEHLTYVKQYEELDATQARWEGMDCMRDGAIRYHTNSSDNITMYPTLEYVAPSINNFEVTMLEPNTDYTIYAEGINKNDTINLGGTDINFNNGTVYTSGDNQWLRIDNNDSFYNMVITKGDTTGEVVPYFEGMTSIENPKLSSKGEGGNLIGECINPTERVKKYKAQLKPNTNYTLTQYYLDGSVNNGAVTLWEGSTQTKYYSPSYWCKFTTPEEITSETLLGVDSWGADIVVHLAEGTQTALTFDEVVANPYKEPSTVSYTDLKLRSLPNGVKDTINVVTGEYIQRVGEMLLNGNESWEHRGTNNGFSTLRSGVLINVANNNKREIKIISNRFVGIPDSGSDNCQFEYVTRPDNNAVNIKVRILASRLKEDTGKGFREWLSENPMTVQYELAEPIITKLDPQTLLAYTDGTINLSSDTGLLPTTHYTVPSTNTFHLPSMKTGTRYTLKYPSASGSITIGDINYSISSDSMLFTTPLKINGDTSAIIFSDANPENVVLLEGAYNKREVPFFTGVKSVKNPNITIIDQLSTESTTYNCETEIELRGLPNGVADKLDIVKGKLTTNVGIRPYQEGDENLPNIWTDGYETVYALSSPVVTNVTIDRPTVTTNSLIDLSSDYLIPQLNYRAPSSNNFPLDLLQPNTTYTLYADTLTSGSYTLGGTRTGVYSQPHTITLGDMTDNLLTFNGDLGLSNVMLVKGNSLKTTLPPYFLGIRSVTDGHLLVEGMAGEMNELTIDEGIVLRDCNGVKDFIDLITCTLTKRTGEITLTGAEGWYRADNESTTDYNVFKLTLGGLKEALVMCDTLQSVFDTKMMDCIHAHTNELCIVIANATIGGNTVNALKSWLNQHPTTVVYQLRVPIEVQLENTWTTLPPTSYDNQTEISSTVSTNSLKPMISVTIATTTLEEIVSSLEAQNAQLEEENIATMLALTSVYETMVTPSVATTEPQVATYGLRRSAEPIGMSVSPMGMVYAKLVSKGFKSIDEVPYNLQAEVMYALRGME